MARDSPQISIITPTYNSEMYLEDAIESVLRQDYPRFEHIIVDGGSTDDTLAIIDNYDHLKVISEPDEGIYDAVNKGIKKASGNLIGWLNSDDVYTRNAFNKLVSKLKANSNAKIVAGSSDIFVEENHNRTTIKKFDFTPPAAFKRGEIRQNGALLNGCLLTDEFVNELGYFDTSFMISGDLEYLIRIAATQSDICRTTDVVYRYRKHENSLTINPSNEFDDIQEVRLLENVEICTEKLKNDQLPRQLKDYCASHFRENSAILFKNYLFNKDILSAFKFATQCSSRDIFWPFDLTKRFVDEFVRKPLFR